MDANGWRRISRALTEAEADLQARENAAGSVECRMRLEAEHGQVWSSLELDRDFEVEAFSAPRVIVIRKADRARGTVLYQHDPRFYWSFEPA